MDGVAPTHAGSDARITAPTTAGAAEASTSAPALAPAAPPTLESLRDRLREFAQERDWDQYHTPRNLLLALVGEAGELAELFQWRGEGEAGPGLPGFSAKERGAVEEELADVLLYLIRLSDVCGVDLGAAAAAKIAKNGAKYPAERCRGSAAKYHTYQEMRAEARQQKRGREEAEEAEEAGEAGEGERAGGHGREGREADGQQR